MNPDNRKNISESRNLDLCSFDMLLPSIHSEAPYVSNGGTILRKQRKKRKSENISKIGIFGNLDLISQNSEFDCVDSF